MGRITTRTKISFGHTFVYFSVYAMALLNNKRKKSFTYNNAVVEVARSVRNKEMALSQRLLVNSGKLSVFRSSHSPLSAVRAHSMK